jgi:hypothetical protein
MAPHLLWAAWEGHGHRRSNLTDRMGVHVQRHRLDNPQSARHFLMRSQYTVSETASALHRSCIPLLRIKSACTKHHAATCDRDPSFPRSAFCRASSITWNLRLALMVFVLIVLCCIVSVSPSSLHTPEPCLLQLHARVADTQSDRVGGFGAWERWSHQT